MSLETNQATKRIVNPAGISVVLATCAAALLGACAGSAAADTVSRSVEVEATPAEVWSMIGPFCAIQDWLPPVGTCTEDGATPPTRTLVTKDGKATFVELQTARDEARYSYSYTFVSSPLPVSNYKSTIAVTANASGGSTVTWSGAYTPDTGKEAAAKEALSGIYDAGLSTIKSKVEN